MNDALLWFDDSPTLALAEKVERAAARYERKYGRLPDLCYVPRDTPDVPCQVGLMRVVTRDFVLSGHFQIGMEEK